jgi:hypothetical protein
VESEPLPKLGGPFLLPALPAFVQFLALMLMITLLINSIVTATATTTTAATNTTTKK